MNGNKVVETTTLKEKILMWIITVLLGVSGAFATTLITTGSVLQQVKDIDKKVEKHIDDSERHFDKDYSISRYEYDRLVKGFDDLQKDLKELNSYIRNRLK